MTTSFWRRWCNSLRSARPTSPTSRARPRRCPLGLEALDDRVTPTLTPQMILDINPGPPSSNPSRMVAIGSTTYFNADDGVHGEELWKSDGTVAGTTLVKDICPGDYNGYYGGYYPNSSTPRFLTNVNGTLFFSALDANHWWELWRSDGTEGGTVKVSSVDGRNLTAVGDTLFFTANGTNGRELWKSDGTTAGTVMVKDIYLGTHRYYDSYGNWTSPWYVPNNSDPRGLTSVNGVLFFTADDGTHGRELWKSDGTEAGTTLVKDIRPGSASSYSYLQTLTDVNGTLFFGANDGVQGNELWKSDGTEAGTTLVKDIRPGSADSFPNALANVNGTLLFRANDGATGVELWRSDGTVAGTTLIKDINLGVFNSYPYPGVTSHNGTLFFTAWDGVHGRELWKSDGTTAGTVLVKDIYPGINTNPNDFPHQLTIVNDTLFFTDYTYNLWQSDGTEAGTVPIPNVFAYSLTNVNGTLFFSAFYDEVHGEELWKLVDDGLLSVTIGDATVTEGHAGTRSATFTVTLSTASDQPVTVAYATADGTAVLGSDYQSASGTLTIPAGQTTGTITVSVIGDRIGEPNETFLLNLSAPTNATIADDGQGVGTIIDDEPRISIGDVPVIEGNIGTRAATFTVTLSAASSEPVSVAYATASATATAGSDYQADSGTLSIPAGQTTGTITVPVNGDRLPETDESFFVKLSGPTNAYIVDSQGIGTILDDEPRISISDVTRTEGKNRQTTLFVFTVTLSMAYDQPVTMSFATTNGTATTSDNDYVGKSGTLTFAPGETTKTITIEVKGDNRREATETFFVDMSGLSSNSLFTRSRGIGTILNDD